MLFQGLGLGIVPSIDASSDDDDDGEGVDVSKIVFSSFAYEENIPVQVRGTKLMFDYRSDSHGPYIIMSTPGPYPSASVTTQEPKLCNAQEGPRHLSPLA